MTRHGPTSWAALSPEYLQFQTLSSGADRMRANMLLATQSNLIPSQPPETRHLPLNPRSAVNPHNFVRRVPSVAARAVLCAREPGRCRTVRSVPGTDWTVVLCSCGPDTPDVGRDSHRPGSLDSTQLPPLAGGSSVPLRCCFYPLPICHIVLLWGDGLGFFWNVGRSCGVGLCSPLSSPASPDL